MPKIIFVMDDDLKLYYQGIARKLSVQENKSVSLSELIRRSLKNTYGVPSKKKGDKECHV